MIQGDGESWRLYECCERFAKHSYAALMEWGYECYFDNIHPESKRYKQLIKEYNESQRETKPTENPESGQ